MALPAAKRLDADPGLELLEGKPKRATPTNATEVALAVRAFTQSEQLALYREGIEQLRIMAQTAGDTARASAAAKLATIFRDAAISKAGKAQVRVLFVDPRELVDGDPDRFEGVADAPDTAPTDFIA